MSSSSVEDHASTHRALRQLAATDDHHNLCGAGLTQVASPVACDPHAHETVHVLHEVLFWFSTAILAVFAVELLGLLVVFRLNFFRTPLYVLDLVVVVTALAFEITLKGQTDGDLAATFIFVRLWRFVRVGHGLYASVHEIDHLHMDELEQHIKHIEEELKALRAANGGRMTRMSSMPQLIKEGVGDDAATSSTKAKGGGGGDDGAGEADDKQSTAEEQI